VDSRAGSLLLLLDVLASLLEEGGRRLPRLAHGLAQVLVDQHRRRGTVLYLTRASPPLHADLGLVGP
jgi:hypothetical protein